LFGLPKRTVRFFQKKSIWELKVTTL
jgi:hypothetical protein